MEPNIAEFSRSNLTVDNFSDCHRESRQLRIVGNSGCEECLMESVRSEWVMPFSANYCKDPVSRRFVDNLHLTQIIHSTVRGELVEPFHGVEPTLRQAQGERSKVNHIV